MIHKFQIDSPKLRTKENKIKNQWARFTYVGKETKFITKLFKDSSIKIAFMTQNTTGKLLSLKQNPHKKQFEKMWSLSINLSNL